MAMDIASQIFIPLAMLVSLTIGKDIYLCTWPTNEVIQLKCDYVNCPYLSVEKIIVGRLYGNPSSCREYNSNDTTRKPVESCTYQLMESHDFFGQVRNNCSRKHICQVSSDEVFQSAGTCGWEEGMEASIRNWVHIQYSCYGDIPGVTCEVPTTTTTTTTTTEKPTTPSVVMTRLRRPGTYRASQQTTAAAPVRSGVTLIIPVLATLLVCTLLLIVVTMLYRHGFCRRKKSWQEAVQDRINNQSPTPHEGKSTKPHMKLDDAQFRINSSKLKELEKRLYKNQLARINSNEYCHDFTFANSSALSKPPSKESLEDVKVRTACRKGRRGSLELPAVMTTPPPTAEMYYSDTSESTITTVDNDFDSNGRRKRRRVKPLPPLPRPVVSHSEVYFTETETESEAPRRSSRRKEPLPKLEPPPKLSKDRPKQERLRFHRPNNDELGGTSTHPLRQTSLELALTKGAAKRLSNPIIHENKVKVVCKKPMARPRSSRTTTSLYGNILMDENMIPSANTIASSDNIAKRSPTVPTNHVYRNIHN